jgi:hypothetical protein
MKKFYYSLFIFLLLSSTAYSQNAYYDAVKLRTYIDPATGRLDTAEAAVKEYSAILKKYTDLHIDDAPTIISKYASNPFIKDLKPLFAGRAGGYNVAMNKIPSSVTKSIGGMNVTNFADGMAKFLVERAKQELNTAFFEKFNQLLKDSTDLQILFPKTYGVLKVVGKEIYNFNMYLNILREAFETDLSNIISNTQNLVDQSPKLASLRNNKKLYASILLAFDLAKSLQQGIHPGEAVSQLEKNYLIAIDSNLYNSVRLYTFLSTSLRSYDANQYWITAEEFRKLEDLITLKFYLGLVYQSMPKDIKFRIKRKGAIQQDSIPYRDSILATFGNHPTNYLTVLKSLFQSFRQVEQSILTLKNKGKEASSFDYYELYNNLLNLIDVAYKELPCKDFVRAEDYGKFKAYAHLTGDIYLNATQRKYSMAVMDLVIFIDSVLPGNKISPSILKYGGFMAAVVQAENSDQVKDAIEAAALPAGSSRIKRESLWNISLNAYLGVYGGAEYIQKLKTNNLKASTGLSAPIGLAFSRGSKCFRKDKTKPGWSYTVFLSFIDIGAIASFRLKDSTTAALPELKLENILAPGAYLIAGIPKSPISLGLFCQYGPTLRSVSAQNITTSAYNQTTWRVGGMIAVDIPLLNLYNKGR